MDLCRTCLKTPANKTISDLENSINEENKNYFDIMLFCLGIQVTEDPKITRKLCYTCYRKIISYYKFKQMSLKNDSYLKSLNPVMWLEDQKLSVYVDENGIKHENPLETDDYGSFVVEENKPLIKMEVDIKYEETSNSYHNEPLAEEGGADEVTNLSQHKPLHNQVPPSGVNKINVNDKNPRCKKPLSVKKPSSVKKPTSVIKPSSVKKLSSVTRKRINEQTDISSAEAQHGRVKNAKPGYETCEECGKHVRNLKQHSVRHLPRDQRKLFPCKVRECRKVFFTRRGQKYHYKMTHLGMKFKCDVCSKDVTNISQHKLQVHNREALAHACAACGRRFISAYVLNLHMNSHTQEPMLECDLCKKKFRAKNVLTSHIREFHERQTKYSCESCAKGFFRKAAYEVHLKNHLLERLYKCKECGKSFPCSITLNKHCLIHQEEKRYQCELCEKRFRKGGALKTHMVSHTKEKPHPCGFCGVRFGRSSHRRRHELAAHKDHSQPTDLITT